MLVVDAKHFFTVNVSIFLALPVYGSSSYSKSLTTLDIIILKELSSLGLCTADHSRPGGVAYRWVEEDVRGRRLDAGLLTWWVGVGMISILNSFSTFSISFIDFRGWMGEGGKSWQVWGERENMDLLFTCLWSRVDSCTCALLPTAFLIRGIRKMLYPNLHRSQSCTIMYDGFFSCTLSKLFQFAKVKP